MSDIQFELSDEIKYQKDGENKKAKNITLVAPSYKTRKKTRKLKQLFYRAAASFQNEGSNKKESSGQEMKPEDLVSMFFASGIDVNEVMDAFEEIILSGHCKIENEVALTEYHLEQITPDDLDNMMGAYLNHFLLSSLMNQLTTSS